MTCCCSYSRLGRRRTTLVVVVFVVLFTTCGTGVHNLKCRTSDHSRRQGEFVDIAEQCKNSTFGGDRSSMVVGLDGDYYSSPYAGQNDRRDNNNNNNRRDNNNNYYNRRNNNNNNREYNVHRQDFANNNYNRGGGYYDDHDTTSCEIHPQQQNSGNNSGRQKNHRQGNSYYPSVDYDVARQTSFNERQSPSRRYRRNANNRRKAVAATGGNRLLGNNRFRNLTKTGGDQSKGSILDKMDACTIHCVFNQLEMLNSNSRPDKRSILNIMTNQIKDVELKEFIHDSIDECFDALELDSHTENKCDFSKNFSVCMENKAQKNCDDWDETGSSMTRTSSSQDGGNGQQLQDKRRGS